MKVLRISCLLIIILAASLLHPIINDNDFSLAQQLKKEIIKLGPSLIKSGGRIKTPKAKELIRKEPSYIKLKPIRWIPIGEIEQIKFETTGYNGESIIFSPYGISKLEKIERDTYSAGDYLTSRGAVNYDAATKLNYIDIIKIDGEFLSVNTYLQLYFKEPSPLSIGSYYEIEGVVGEVFSQDRIYLDEVLDLREISIDKNHIIEVCSSSIRGNVSIIISECAENEELRNWMSKEYGLLSLSKNQILETLAEAESIQINYDFFDEMAICIFRGKTFETNKDFGIELMLRCLYNSNSEDIEKIHISFIPIPSYKLLTE